MNFSRTNDQIILIDGGLGTTMQEYGLAVLDDPLWLMILREIYIYIITCIFFALRSGRILATQPEQLARVHRA